MSGIGEEGEVFTECGTGRVSQEDQNVSKCIELSTAAIILITRAIIATWRRFY